jgi:hypothetical protein
MVGTESGGQWSREKKTDAAATVEPTIPVTGDSTFQSNRRPRSLSVASAQPSVETVVTKAKRAASTLWTLLHAQVGWKLQYSKRRSICSLLSLT